MMGKFRKYLIKDLESRLISRLQESGFQLMELNSSELSDRQFTTAFPLGFYRRPCNGGYDLVDIQFDPRGEALFTVNAAHVGPEGIHLPWGQIVDMERAHASDSLSYVSLVDGPVRKRWFGPGFLGKKSPTQAQEIVDRALEKFEEVETWLQSREVGRHLVVITTQ